MQRAFRLRRAEHLATLEERINLLESENSQLRALLALPEAERDRIGSGPTGRGKSLREGGVPMSERVRARKEARARERRLRGIPEPEAGTSDTSDHARDSETLSPGAAGAASNAAAGPSGTSQAANDAISSLFGPAATQQEPGTPFQFNLPTPFTLPVSDPSYPEFSQSNIDQGLGNLFKPSTSPAAFNLFGMFGDAGAGAGPSSGNKSNMPLSPPLSSNSHLPASRSSSANQPGLLERLKACCHLSDSHVVNDPGLLIFATRLCQSFPCPSLGTHTEPNPHSDSEYLLLEESWRALKSQLDPGGEADGENRINTGRMAAELVIRAAHGRGAAASVWIVCRFREGMSVKRTLIVQLVQGLGGKMT